MTAAKRIVSVASRAVVPGARAADGQLPRNLHLEDGRPLTNGMLCVPMHFKCEWAWTDGATLGNAQLIDLATGAILKDRTDAATPELSFYDLECDHRYRVRVQNITPRNDPWLEVDFRSRVCQQPTITRQPAGQTVCQGQSATFLVTADGEGGGRYVLAYQWRKNGVAIPGATAASHTITSVGPGDEADYSVVVDNVCSSVTSISAHLAVQSPPAVSRLPDVTLREGGSTHLCVSVGGTPTPSVQWYKDGAPISGATGLCLSLTNVTSSAAGAYWVVAANACGTARSSNILVVVTNPLPRGWLRGHVWNDRNQNRLRDGEPAFPDAFVYLDRDNNGTWQEGEPWTLSDTNGYYVFTNLSAGSYWVRQDCPSGFIETVPGAAGDHLVVLTNDLASAQLDFADKASFRFTPPYVQGGVWESTFAADIGVACRVLASSDLKTWTTLTNLVGTNFAVTIRDSRRPARQMRFYRAIRQ